MPFIIINWFAGFDLRKSSGAHRCKQKNRQQNTNYFFHILLLHKSGFHTRFYLWLTDINIMAPCSFSVFEIQVPASDAPGLPKPAGFRTRPKGSSVLLVYYSIELSKGEQARCTSINNGQVNDQWSDLSVIIQVRFSSPRAVLLLSASSTRRHKKAVFNTLRTSRQW